MQKETKFLKTCMPCLKLSHQLKTLFKIIIKLQIAWLEVLPAEKSKCMQNAPNFLRSKSALKIPRLNYNLAKQKTYTRNLLGTLILTESSGFYDDVENYSKRLEN